MMPNNFDFIRLVAAFLVLYGHSFVFLGLPEPLFLSWVPLGPLGVYIFFTISGYLITESWERDPNLIRFFQRRALRIFPGLIVCVLLLIFFLGLLLTTLSWQDYFKNQYTWQYLSNIVLYITYYLPGTFATNRVPNAVNGSLWSLPAEFFMYILVAVFGCIKVNRWFYPFFAFLLMLASYFWATKSKEMLVIYNTDLRQVVMCGVYFWVGSAFYKFKIKQYFSVSSIVMAFILLCCFEKSSFMFVAAWILLPIIVLGFGFSYSDLLHRLVSTGDYSYGVYIYAFPIQQSVVYLYPNMSIGLYLLVCSILTMVCAFFSWHLIEKKALLLKPRAIKSSELNSK